uniref:Cytochrome c oxidase subunit 3 n=1 Tax=Zancudomyces culisetae TaxID=1213189 RepID=Q3T4A3_ZANCU|nr:cytochrome c oxidase subunit 3 [Zancudomyces culisetae]AAW49511.1 cytochrome c oxidase subunit 3 [Zancudomyces culisetae]
MQLYPNHIVETSPWPIVTSISLANTLLSIVLILQGFNSLSLKISIISLILSMSLWWKDVIIESTYQGHHTTIVMSGIKIGFLLFILSEIFVFLSVFWAQLNAALVPEIELGGLWPPLGIEAVNPFGIPLLNTLLLLSSGATVTWAHYSMIKNTNKKETIISLFLTILYATIFTLLQLFEYYYAPFSFVDGVYGCTFYAGTGLHALHVLVGNTFLIVALYRIIKNHFTQTHHLGFELAIIYWHFVDIVWLLLFIIFYYWAS